MAQKNEMSARALSMEELENVNGGIIHRLNRGGIKAGGKCEFGIRV
jgi:hypothetical protein